MRTADFKFTEQEKELFIQNSMDLLCIIDFDGHFQRVSPSFTRMLGWGLDELTGQKYLDFVHRDDRKICMGAMTDLFSGKDISDLDIRVVCKDMALKGISWNVHPLIEQKVLLAQGRVISDRKVTRSALRSALAEIQAYYAGAPIALAVFDTDLRYVRINDRMAQMNGIPVSDHIGRTVSEIIPQFAELAKQITDRIIKFGEPETNIEFSGETLADPGVTHTWREHWFPIKNGDGRIVAITVAAEDITERKCIEEQLRASHDRLKLASDAAGIGIWDWDIVRGQLTFDEKSREIFGLSPESPVSPELWSRSIHPADSDMVQRAIEDAIGHRKDYMAEYRIIGPDEKIHWIHQRGDTFFNKRGKPLRMSGIAFDITDARRAEEELRKSRDELEIRVHERTTELKQFASVVENATEGIILARGFTAFYVNPAFEKISGYTAAEIIDKDLSMMRSDEHPVSLYENIREKALADRMWDGTWPAMTKNGATVFLDLHVFIIGEIGVTAFICHDITGKIRLEEQLRQSHKMEAIGTLAGGIAHDFNNILAGIIGFSEMVEEDLPADSIQRQYMKRVLEASFRGRDLVKQILSFSRKVHYERSGLSLWPIVQETYKLLRASIPTAIDIILDNNVGNDIVNASPVEIQQIVMNLVTNAARAMSKKGGTLKISLRESLLNAQFSDTEPDMTPGEYLQLVIEDTGTGMKPEVMKRIFEPFFTTSKRGQGTGMGLAVVYGIVKSLQGAITVESQPKKGSVFRIFLPRAVADFEVEGVAVEAPPNGTGRILLVDDEQDIVNIGEAALQRLGYHVTGTIDSKAALDMFLSDPEGYDIVITDQTMPGLSGFDLAKKILKIRRNMPVILCTGHSDIISLDAAKAAGIAEFMMKPFSRHELAQAISGLLEKKDA